MHSMKDMDPHLHLLREYAATCPVATDEYEAFRIDTVSKDIPVYHATLPPIIREWVEARPEVDHVEQSVRNTLGNRPNSSQTPDAYSPLLEIPYTPGIPYEPHKYTVATRTNEELDAHIELLRAYVESCPIELHDNVGFMVKSLVREGDNLGYASYSALLPPMSKNGMVLSGTEVVSRSCRQGVEACSRIKMLDATQCL
ncbi:hypothetical protein DFH09DRAFT_463221 [Mycena vulgaris]|nr:hypothetical protein DFH09DRAFT_463221 [Mycena vulgaris]